MQTEKVTAAVIRPSWCEFLDRIIQAQKDEAKKIEQLQIRMGIIITIPALKVN
jgi:hypothetical protein